MSARCSSSPEGLGYVPIDELLSMPRFRILRALRRFDWISSTDLYEAIGVQPTELDNYSQMILRLSRAGMIDRVGAGPVSRLCRITAAGRRQYDLLLARTENLPPIADSELERRSHRDRLVNRSRPPRRSQP